MTFFRSIFEELRADGDEVVLACGDMGGLPEEIQAMNLPVYPLSCTRAPFRKGTISAIREIRKIIEQESIDIVHCHTPIAAACTRLACRKMRKRGLKVVYTAHGFHFFRGAPLKNWLIYFPVEWISSFWTDYLITINKEDNLFATKHLHARQCSLVPGVGIDMSAFSPDEMGYDIGRAALQISSSEFCLLSVGELNANKNHALVLESLALLSEKMQIDFKYLIAGEGPLKEYLRDRAEELGINDRVELLGFRKDTAVLYAAADLFVFPSFREGLPVSVMEALASGDSVLCSNCRGCSDLVAEELRFDPKNKDELSRKIFDKYNDCWGSSRKRKSLLPARYSNRAICSQIKGIYQALMG